MPDLFGWLRNRSLAAAINETKKVKVDGVVFRIRKINPLDHASGARVLQQIYTTYQAARQAAVEPNVEKIKQHYAEVILAGAVSPRLCRKQEDHGRDGAVWVEHLFADWDLVQGLYDAIMSFTYGKKKVSQAYSLANVSSKPTS